MVAIEDEERIVKSSMMAAEQFWNKMRKVLGRNPKVIIELLQSGRFLIRPKTERESEKLKELTEFNDLPGKERD